MILILYIRHEVMQLDEYMWGEARRGCFVGGDRVGGKMVYSVVGRVETDTGIVTRW